MRLSAIPKSRCAKLAACSSYTRYTKKGFHIPTSHSSLGSETHALCWSRLSCSFAIHALPSITPASANRTSSRPPRILPWISSLALFKTLSVPQPFLAPVGIWNAWRHNPIIVSSGPCRYSVCSCTCQTRGGNRIYQSIVAIGTAGFEMIFTTLV